MSTQLQQPESICRTPISQVCDCEHCIAIKIQQQKSELQWLSEHQLFDR